MRYTRRSFVSLMPSAALLTCGWNAEAQRADAVFSFAVVGGASRVNDNPNGLGNVAARLNAEPLAFVLHVGDSGMSACSRNAYRVQREALNRIRHPVIYTPGDHDWYDCEGRTPGDAEPLDRLHDLRNVFFNPPGRSLGGRGIALETQATSRDFREFAENARYAYGGLVVATVGTARRAA